MVGSDLKWSEIAVGKRMGGPSTTWSFGRRLEMRGVDSNERDLRGRQQGIVHQSWNRKLSLQR